MKKFALGILSVFMILGGVLLSACEKKVSLSVSETEVVLYTNYENGENNQSKEIEVDVQNSKAGINVEIMHGQDCVDLDRSNTSRAKANGKYAFKILTKQDKSSGVAQLKVSSLDDSKQFQYINVTVNTIVEEIKVAGDNSEDGKTNLFVVKGADKELVTTDYFDLLPVYANITDVDWTFEGGEKQISIDGKVCAEIVGSTLKVSKDYTLRKIDIVANYVLNRDINRKVTLQVLEDSTIRSYTVEDNVFYRNGTLQTTQATVSLKRNNSNLSVAQGVLVFDVDSENELKLKPVVYKRGLGQPVLIDNDEFEQYFIFDYSERDDEVAGTKTYNFTIDAIDSSAKNMFGQFEVYFEVEYAGYNYSVSTKDALLILDIAYSATQVELTDGEGYSINNTSQDVFSSYETSFGYEVNTVIGPTDVAIDDRYFRITFDVNQEALRNYTVSLVDPVGDLAVFYTSDGNPIEFTRSATGSSIFVSRALETGTKVFVKGQEVFDEIENIEFKFEARSNSDVSTSLFFTFYKIADDKTMTVSGTEEHPLEQVTYLSSSVYSERELEFVVRIDGISTTSGLSLKSDNLSGFEYSNITLLSKSEENEEDSFVVVSFNVRLTAYNFADVSNFWFEHITGKMSSQFAIETFVPIESLTIQNSDKSSANVYIDKSENQDYIVTDGLIEKVPEKQSYSLSNIMLEAGTSLPIYTSYQNATLTDRGISYRFMSFDNLKLFIRMINVGTVTDDQEIERLANEAIANGDLSLIANSDAYMYFRDMAEITDGYFSITGNRLTVSNRPFKGFVAVLAEGYDENHEEITLVRFFALESFYSVRYLSSNVRTTLLYTADTLSLSDISRSYVDVSISMRQDDNIPTYSNSLDYFNFSSALQDFYDVTETKTFWKNDFYSVSNVMLANNGKNLTFRISAKSTNLQTSVKDVLRIVYKDTHGFEKSAEIQIEIKNVKRLESVQWVNRTADNEIYLNLTTTNESEKNFTISTSVEPSDANDIGLTSLYVASSGSASDIKISTSSIGQIFNVNINTTKGGRGHLYLLPNDMIKSVNGFDHILVYKYIENEDGTITEIPVNIPLSNLASRYDEIIAGSDEITNYFYNNEGEKVYYENIILKIAITIADGSSEGTAIRVYNQGDLEEIDYAKYYRVMNDITLSGWKAYERFSGMIYGNNGGVTLKFTNGSESFVNSLSGTLKDLTFVGDVEVNNSASAGFVANTVEATGLIDNCLIDVYYVNTTNSYYGSVLKTNAPQNAGMIAGLNAGSIKNIRVYGGSIDASAVFVGGIVGENNGLVENCGFEFYKFENEKQTVNTITTTGSFGGIVGVAGGTSVVRQAYVYAYALPNVVSGDDGVTSNDYSTSNIINADVVRVFAGSASNGARFSETFGFIGDVNEAFSTSGTDQYVTLENCYITYFADEAIRSDVFKTVSYSFVNGQGKPEVGYVNGWVTLNAPDNEEDNTNLAILSLDEKVWDLEKTNTEINFGYVYLKNIAQSTAVELDEIHVKKEEYSSTLRVLDSGKRIVDGEEFETGILFMYNPIVQITDVQEKATLDRLNSISIADLFGITSEQAKSLLLTSESKNIMLSADSIRLTNPSTRDFEVSVHSKMDFTQVKPFRFMILNTLPTLTTMIDGISIKDNQIVLLQTGASRTIVYSTLSSLYLSGTTQYALSKDEFTINHSYVDSSNEGGFVNVIRSSNSLVLSGLVKHENDNRTTVDTRLSHNALSENAEYTNYANVVNDKISRMFDIRVYNGAKRLEVTNANNLIVRPSEYATFDVVMETDEQSDGLVFALKYDEVEVEGQSSDNFVRFDVDSNLSLEVSWALLPSNTEGNTTQNRYKVLVKVSEDTKHLVDFDYSDLVLSVNALSQAENNTYIRYINIKVETQKIEDFSISTYSIERRQIRNSILYLTPSSQLLNTLSPANDAIVSVAVTPQYAQMTHFTLTYEVDGNAVGTVGISKLAYNPLYGYYTNSTSSVMIANGIRVNLTEADKTGTGVFYFRLYISSSFASTSGVKLVVTFYNGDEVGKFQNGVDAIGTQNITVDYMQDAYIRVNDASTYLIAKGETATVTVRIGLDQDLYDLYIQNNETGISLSTPTVEIVGNYKVYTAEISAQVNATLVGGLSSGLFYVCASVERVLNNIQEIKTVRATLCLVDFSVNADGISVVGSGNKRTYNGKSYDVFNAYINDNSELHFNYPILPEEYNYDRNDIASVNAVERLLEKRNEFLNNNYYKDDEVKYYINYIHDYETGRDNPITLKQQLWYATDETHSTAMYNENRNTIVQNDYFGVTEETLTGGSSRIMISGKRAGTQLMKLRTTINYQGIELVSDYYFLIVVEVWTDEESPTQITTAEEFIDYATNSQEPADYILMNDIVLADYTPLSTSLINSLDGNGFTIHINSFKYPEGSSLRLALFDSVEDNTTLRNIRVNIYNGGQIFVNIRQYTSVEIAGFALSNAGVVYNCEVVSYYDENYQVSRNTGNSGLIVKYTNGANTDPIPLTYSMGIESKVSGFIIENTASVMNSRVGGEQFKHIIQVDGTNYLKSQNLDVFYLEGQGEVSGFVNANSGYVSACFVKNIQIDNIMEYDGSITSGFVITNTQSVQNSYVEGLGGETETIAGETKEIVWNNLTNISSLGVISGFVYENSALVKNSYSNIAIENSKTKGAMVAGFVYRNNEGAEVTLCYAACQIAKKDITQMQFSGVDDFTNSLNNGSISLSYFYNDSRSDDTIQSRVSTSALSVHDVDKKNSFYGFSFASGDSAYDGIWKMGDNGKISLVSANIIALSNRYATTNGRVTSIFYSRSIRDIDTLSYIDLSYGSAANPIILRNAADFAKATGKATSTEISSYKEYYNDREVTGRYRIVNNIEMTDIAQDAEDDGAVKLTTAKKTFRGLLDGNGFTISNISLGSSELVENFGLFARLDNAVIMNLDLTVESVHNTQANIVGVLAGTAVDSRILAIKLSPAGTSNEGESTAVQGHNVVGGVVGMMFGESYLSDISVSNVDVSSEGYTEGKTIDANKQYIEGKDDDTIKSLRYLVELLDNGIDLKSNVERLSYAGAIAGFIDIYSSSDEGFVSFSNNLEVGDYDVVTVRVSDSVNIYAEVAGGVFGYVGKSTLIYDASISINQNTALSTQGASPSYIISKNLFAGGLVGENYGGLFAVSASYEANLQKQIEESENSYYTSVGDVERGQMSIFSYTPNDEGYLTRTNKPRFIGGLVGYMGGGYIYVGISKLNVISHTDAIVGGAVGLSGGIGNRYDLTFTTQRKAVNTLYYEVYASGDAYSEGSVSGGIIGAVEMTENASSIVAMKNVMAMNYYSYSGFSLTADKTAPTGNDKTYQSDKHFMLAGGIYAENTLQSKETRLLSDFYLINSVNDFALNLKDGTTAAPIGSFTVGGYKQILIGDVVASLKEFGFFSPAETMKKDDGRVLLDADIVNAVHIGEENLNTPSSAYARMKNYFISNGWDEKYWTHEQNRLFPDIVLLPKVTIEFWDVDNTKDILEKMKNDASGTFVVRGRTVHDDENCLERQDINLTPSNPDYDKIKELLTVDSFRGRLVSYEAYMNTQEGGKITSTVTGGGNDEEKVGIILSQPLFENLKGSASIEGMNFYLTPKVVDGKKVGFSIISNEADSAFLRNVNVVVNEHGVNQNGVIVNSGDKNFIINSKSSTNIHFDEGRYESIGLVAGLATSTSFYNINIKFRGEANVELVGNEAGNKVYMGLLAGRIRQKSAQSQMSINGINVVRARRQGESETTPISESPIDITFRAKSDTSSEAINNESELFAGIYSGAISKNLNAVSVSVGVVQINNINLNLETAEGSDKLKKVSVGGYFGAFNGADRAEFVEGDDDNSEGTGITINQKCKIAELSAGLAFGQNNAEFNFSFERTPNAWMIGRLVQSNGVTTEKAKIGSIVGESNQPVTLTGLRVKFDVSNETMYTAGSDTEDGNTLDKWGKFNRNANTLKENKYDYTSQNLINPYIISNADDKDNAVGGVVGFAGSGSYLILAGFSNVLGNLIVGANESSDGGVGGYASVGAVVGKYTGSSSEPLTIGGTVTNTVNIYANMNEVNAGGLVGDFGGDSGIANSLEIGTSNSVGSIQYNGQIVLPKAKTLNVGGAIGRLMMSETNASASAKIKGFAFGGAVKTLVVNEASANVGGVIGFVGVPNDADLNKNADVTIENAVAYGDAFMIYPETYTATTKFNHYGFGGIVGSAQTGLEITKCVSLFTNFNRGNLNTNSSGNVGAIVGANAGVVTYSENKYSSGVVLAYQEESGNSDYGYGAEGFAGYTTMTQAVGDVTVERNGDILNGIRSLVSGASAGHKLNPFTIETNYSGELDKDSANITGSFNNIKWVAIAGDLTNENKLTHAIADKLVNMAIVGNGRTIESELLNKDAAKEEDKAIYIGGIANTMGMQYGQEANQTQTPNFNVISGMIVDLDISHNIKKENATKGTYQHAFGGVTGLANGNSFVYGVGVSGSLSIGGNTRISLAGMVGQANQCRIEQSYIDADITYRGLGASDNGMVSGVANLQNFDTTIKSTYSSGKIISYVDAPIYTFASAGTKNEQAHMLISDCYSITQVERNNILSDTAVVGEDTNVFFMGTQLTKGLGQVINGTAEVYQLKQGTVDTNDTKYVASSVMALSYSNANKYKGVSLKANDDYEEKPVAGGDSQTTTVELKEGVTGGENTWYFSRLTNYGYASHAFGYLKNSTTYTYDSDSEEYVPVDYGTLLRYGNNLEGTPIGDNAYKLWVLGIPSVGKFDQMLETVSSDETNTDYKNGRDYYRFVLRYGFSLDKSAKVNASKEYSVSSVGMDGKNFLLDGGNNTIDFTGISLGTGLFDEVNGGIINLRLYNASISTTETSIGVLASTLTGSMENITAIGDIDIADIGTVYAGGVVGDLKGNANRIESLVNITNTEANVIMGGVVGRLQGGKVTYASNTGILQNFPASAKAVDGELKVDTIKLGDGKTGTADTNIKLNENAQILSAVTGGIVGYGSTGENSSSISVENSYNANSVLSNFAKNKLSEDVKDSNGNVTEAAGKSMNVVSGGIVGYSSAAVTINNSYNASLVGAGNYGNADKVSYAGGIIGYAGALNSMENCVNDGPVQALGGQDSAYKVTTSIVNGAQKIEDATATPEDYIMKITMIYNPGDVRLVNAYGLGYIKSVTGSIESAKLSTSKSTTNNIKNDGNIGEIRTTSYLRLNRQQMLDGDGENGTGGNYVGSFETNLAVVAENVVKNTGEEYLAEAKLNISGLDSYGFPTRVYGTDTINRKLSDDHGYVKLLKVRTGAASYEGIDSKAIKAHHYFWWHGGQFTYGAKVKATLDSSGTLEYTKKSDDGKTDVLNLEDSEGKFRNTYYDDNLSKVKLKDGLFDYNLETSTEYYSSSILSGFWGDTYLNFDGYDSILAHLNSYSYFVNTSSSSSLLSSNNTVLSSSSYQGSTIKQYVDEKIAEIDAEIEKNGNKLLETINVAGEEVAIARTFNNFKTALSPNSVSAGLINIKLPDDVNAKTITKDNVVFAGCEYVEYDVKAGDNNTLTITGSGGSGDATLYFATEGSHNVTITLSVKSTPINFKISNNNSTFEDGKLKIDLEAFEEKSKLESSAESDSKYTINSAIIEGITISAGGEIQEFDAYLSDENKKLTIDIGNAITNMDELNEKTVQINMTYFREFDDIETFSISNSRTVYQHRQLGSSSSSEFKFTYKNYNEVSMASAMPTLSSFTESGGQYTISYQDFMTALNFDRTKAFAYEIDGVAFYWDGQSSMTIGGGASGVQIDADGNNVKISGTNSRTFIQNANSKTATGYVIINDSDNLIIRAKDGHTNPQSLIMFNEEFTDVSSGTIFPFIKFVGSTTTENGRFVLSNRGFGGYEGTTTNFAEETSRDNIEISSPIASLPGIKLKTADVTFGYTFSATLDSSGLTENYAIELNTRRSGNVVETRYFGGTLNKDDTTIYDLNVQLGDIVELKTSLTRLTFQTEKVTEVKEEDGVAIIKVSGDNHAQYNIEQGTGTIFGKSVKFVTTNKITSTEISNTKIRDDAYIYKIWANGIIEMISEGEIYTYSTTGDLKSTEKIDGDKYIYIPEETEGHSLGYYKFSTSGNTYILGEKISEPWAESSEWNMLKSNFEKIALGYEKENLYLINNTDSTQTFSIECHYNKITPEDDYVGTTLLVGNDSSKPISSGTVAGWNAQNVSIHGDGPNGEIKLNNATHTFEGEEDMGDYSNVYWQAEFKKNMEKNASQSAGANLQNVKTILLDADIDMGVVSNLGISKNVIGCNYVMRFAGASTSVFSNIGTETEQYRVLNTLFAGTNSNADSLFADSILGKIDNVQLYGTIRNVSYDRSTDVLPTYKSDSDVEAGNISSLTSYVTVVGLNSPTGRNFSTKFMETSNASDINILVAGDAVKGENATNSYNRLDYSKIINSDNTVASSKLIAEDVMLRAQKSWTRTYSNAIDGANGKTGGVIEETTTNSPSGISLNGFSSIGGYGGDGAHGRCNTISNNIYVIGGSKAGKAGTAGTSDSSLLHADVKQYRGNSGIGGFGRIKSSGTTYMLYGSANGGTDIDNGSNGTSIGYVVSGKDKVKECFFGAGTNKYCSSVEPNYNHGWGDDDFGSTIEKINGNLKTVTNFSSFKYGGVLSGNSNNKGTKRNISQLYVYVDMSFCYRVIPDNRDLGYSYKISWTSGETVNGAGGFTACTNS